MKWQCEILIVVAVAIISLPSLVDAFTSLSSIVIQQNWRLKSVLFLQINDDDTFEDDVITSPNINGYIQKRCKRRRRDFMITLLSTSIPLSSTSSAKAATTEEEERCKNGSILPESPVPGAYSQVCMNLDERTFRLTSIKEDNSISVHQGTNSGAGEVAGRTGGKMFCVHMMNESAYQSYDMHFLSPFTFHIHILICILHYLTIINLKLLYGIVGYY